MMLHRAAGWAKYRGLRVQQGELCPERELELHYLSNHTEHPRIYGP